MLFVWQVPKVMAGDKPLTALFHQIHALSAWVLLGLIGLHILTALFHRFVLRDRRMRRNLLSRLTRCRHARKYQDSGFSFYLLSDAPNIKDTAFLRLLAQRW